MKVLGVRVSGFGLVFSGAITPWRSAASTLPSPSPASNQGPGGWAYVGLLRENPGVPQPEGWQKHGSLYPRLDVRIARLREEGIRGSVARLHAGLRAGPQITCLPLTLVPERGGAVPSRIWKVVWSCLSCTAFNESTIAPHPRRPQCPNLVCNLAIPRAGSSINGFYPRVSRSLGAPPRRAL